MAASRTWLLASSLGWSCILAFALAVLPQSQHGDSEAESVLFSVMTGPLAGDNILLYFDNKTSDLLNIGALLSNVKTTSSSIVLMNADDPRGFLLKAPVAFIRGSFLTAILVFMEHPRALLESFDVRWNPHFLLLVNLNKTLDSKEILGHEAVQRSRHLTLIEREGKTVPSRFLLHTSRPFRPTRGGYALQAPMGRWNKRRFQTKSALFLERFATFDGIVLHLGSWCDDFPFLYPGEDVKCVGTSFDLLDIIAEKLNFSYTIQMETADHNWGSKENGTWTGMLGDLVYNNKDLVINYFLLTEERNADFDTTYAYYSEGFGFALRIPPPVPQWRGLLYPFTRLVWISTICTTLLVIALLSACLVLVSDTQDASQVFLLILGGIWRQSVYHRLESSWSRLWTGWWWLATVIITTGYTSNLVAFLTVPVYPTRIETVDKLADSHLRVCMQDYGNFLPEALKISNDDSLRQLGNRLDLFPYAYLSYDIGFGWVMNNTHAIVETYSYLVHVLHFYNHTDDTYIMKENVYPGYLTWFLKKNCPYTEILSSALTRLVESGLVNRFYYRHMVKSLKKQGANSAQRGAGSPLQLGQLLGALMLWLMGMAAAAVVFALELGSRVVAKWQ